MTTLLHIMYPILLNIVYLLIQNKPCMTPNNLHVQCFRQSTGDSDSTGQSEESCTTTFSTSPCGEPLRTKGSPASHHQSQPIKINIQGSSPVTDKFPDLRPQRYV